MSSVKACRYCPQSLINFNTIAILDNPSLEKKKIKKIDISLGLCLFQLSSPLNTWKVFSRALYICWLEFFPYHPDAEPQQGLYMCARAKRSDVQIYNGL